MTATRYVTPLREGGSLPGIVEADDLGTYVVKFTGAGQGVKALVAEVVAGELGRTLGLRVPELVVVDLDPVVARAEPDWEVQELLARSGGPNLGMDFLPGAIGFDPVAHTVDPDEAARVLWFDALVENVDRTWRNPNLLRWPTFFPRRSARPSSELWCIDHGACLYFHHSWARAAGAVGRAYDTSDHVLAPATTAVSRATADEALAPAVTREALEAVVAAVPGEWLAEDDHFPSVAAAREAYVEHLLARLAERGVGAVTTAPNSSPRNSYEWAPLRVVPRVDRGECVNVGVLLYCRHEVHLTIRLALDPARLTALAPDLDVEEVATAVRAWERTVAGEGPAGVLSVGERFRWLTAPRSTVVQAGPVHTGLTDDPEAEVGRLLERLV